MSGKGKPVGKGKTGKGAPPPLTKKEQDALKAADKVSDIESDDVKRVLRKELRMLRDSVKEEEQMLSLYQQEREKINYNWIIGKKEFDDKKSELNNKEREISDLRENHMMTINLYKQKVKHLLFQNQDNQTAVKKDVEISLKQVEDEHRIKERELKFDLRALGVQEKEQELSHQEYTFALRGDYLKKATESRQDYEREYNNIKGKYHLKMEKLRKEMEDARAAMIKQIEDKKDLAIKELTANHTKKYAEIKNYYAEITATNFDMIKRLKNQINELTKKEEQDRKLLAQAEMESRNLKGPLSKLKDEIQQLEIEKIEYERLKEEKEEIKKKIGAAEGEFRRMEFEYEVKLQQFKYLEREKDSLLQKFNDAVYEISKKIGLKNLILINEVNFISEDLEIKDLQLNQVLTASNLDPQALGEITRSIEEVETMKNDLLNELQSELGQIRKAHTHMVKAYEGKLAEFVIPVEELGFDPLVPTNTE